MSFLFRNQLKLIRNFITNVLLLSLSKVWMFFSKQFDLLMRQFFLALVQIYRLGFSPFFGGYCRFEPSCSAYALESFQKHTFFRAFFLTTKRLFSCHPGGRFGYDPVPCCHPESSQHLKVVKS